MENVQGEQNQEIPYETDIDDFKLLVRGFGIDEKELYIITHSAYDCLKKKMDPLSDAIVKSIKKVLGGEWFTFSMFTGVKGFDFSLSIFYPNDYLCFTIGKFKFQICRLRD